MRVRSTIGSDPKLRFDPAHQINLPHLLCGLGGLGLVSIDTALLGNEFVHTTRDWQGSVCLEEGLDHGRLGHRVRLLRRLRLLLGGPAIRDVHPVVRVVLPPPAVVVLVGLDAKPASAERWVGRGGGRGKCQQQRRRGY